MANFFRGTTHEQDGRWSGIDKKLVKRMEAAGQFAAALKAAPATSLSNVNLDVMGKWVTDKLTELMGFEDEIVIGTIVNTVEKCKADKAPLDGKNLQVQLMAFLDKQAKEFVQELWTLLLDAQASPHGIPSAFVEQKKKELREAKEEQARARAAAVVGGGGGGGGGGRFQQRPDPPRYQQRAAEPQRSGDRQQALQAKARKELVVAQREAARANEHAKQSASAHVCAKFSYNYATSEWEQSKAAVYMEPEPFAHGGMRSCWRATEWSDLSPGRDPNGGVASVLKRFQREVPNKTYFNECLTQTIAESYAQEFNRAAAAVGIDQRVRFMHTTVIKSERTGTYCAIEPWIAGDYVKHNDTLGNMETGDELATAFSLFSYYCSKMKLVICDIQGVGSFYTDPQIHSTDGMAAFGAGNFGRKGIQAFLRGHQHNKLCIALGMPHPFAKSVASFTEGPIGLTIDVVDFKDARGKRLMVTSVMVGSQGEAARVPVGAVVTSIVGGYKVPLDAPSVEVFMREFKASPRPLKLSFEVGTVDISDQPFVAEDARLKAWQKHAKAMGVKQRLYQGQSMVQQQAEVMRVQGYPEPQVQQWAQQQMNGVRSQVQHEQIQEQLRKQQLQIQQMSLGTDGEKQPKPVVAQAAVAAAAAKGLPRMPSKGALAFRAGARKQPPSGDCDWL